MPNYFSPAIVLNPAPMGEYCLVGEEYSEDFLLEQNPVKDHIFMAFWILSIRKKAWRDGSKEDFIGIPMFK